MKQWLPLEVFDRIGWRGEGLLWLAWVGPGGVLVIQEQGAYMGIQVLLWPLVEEGAVTQGVGGTFLFLFYFFFGKSLG